MQLQYWKYKRYTFAFYIPLSTVKMWKNHSWSFKDSNHLAQWMLKMVFGKVKISLLLLALAQAYEY